MNSQDSTNPGSSAAAEGYSSGGGVTGNSGTLAETESKIEQTTRDAASKVKGVASDTALRAKEEATRFAAEKKAATARRIGSYSSAMHETASSLEEKDPNIAWFTHRAADKLQGIAEYMRDRDFTALREDAEEMARRHPGAFFGGMFLAGLVVGNMVKASRRNLDERNYGGETDYDPEWSRRASEREMQPPDLTDAERSAAGI
jgi:hypothetical protein